MYFAHQTGQIELNAMFVTATATPGSRNKTCIQLNILTILDRSIFAPCSLEMKTWNWKRQWEWTSEQSIYVFSAVNSHVSVSPCFTNFQFRFGETISSIFFSFSPYTLYSCRFTFWIQNPNSFHTFRKWCVKTSRVTNRDAKCVGDADINVIFSFEFGMRFSHTHSIRSHHVMHRYVSSGHSIWNLIRTILMLHTRRLSVETDDPKW